MKCLCFNILTEMATFDNNRKDKKPVSVGCSGIFLLLVGSCQFVATSVTWTTPPPAWTQTNPGDFETVVMPLLNGSTQVPLRWSYTLSPGSNLQSTGFSIDDGGFVAIGKIFHTSGITTVFDTDYKSRLNISRSEVATLIIFEVTEREEKVFECELVTTTNTWRYRIQVIVTVPVKLTRVSGDQTVREGSNTSLFCEGTGTPTPNITLTRVLKSGSDGETLPQMLTYNFPNINRSASGTYNCTAENQFETVSQVFKVNVTYPAKIVNLKSEHEVPAQQSVSLDCEAEGNPEQTYTWTPCDSEQRGCHERELNVQTSNKSVYTFTCKVANNLGNDARNTTIFIASDVINVTLVITGEECTDGKFNQLWERLKKMINAIFAGKLGYESVQQKNIRCGSVIVDLALKFNSTVRESEVLSILHDAAKTGGFGDFNVSAITGTRDTGIKTTMATTPTSSSDSTTWIIVGVVLGGVFLLVIVGVVAWHVYRKRKCKKRDSKVHNNGPQGEEGGNVKNEGYVEVNRGYEGGNRSSVPPVVYDTAQTGNRGAVQGPPQYAVVDKSKRNPKKKKPGELQYAELAEFSAGQGGPRSSTSPTNRPTEIQYADVNAM